MPKRRISVVLSLATNRGTLLKAVRRVRRRKKKSRRKAGRRQRKRKK
jgi:hypothetical protein